MSYPVSCHISCHLTTQQPCHVISRLANPRVDTVSYPQPSAITVVDHSFLLTVPSSSLPMSQSPHYSTSGPKADGDGGSLPATFSPLPSHHLCTLHCMPAQLGILCMPTSCCALPCSYIPCSHARCHHGHKLKHHHWRSKSTGSRHRLRLIQGSKATKSMLLPVAKARDPKQRNVECSIKSVAQNPQTVEGCQAKSTRNEECTGDMGK